MRRCHRFQLGKHSHSPYCWDNCWRCPYFKEEKLPISKSTLDAYV